MIRSLSASPLRLVALVGLVAVSALGGWKLGRAVEEPVPIAAPPPPRVEPPAPSSGTQLAPERRGRKVSKVCPDRKRVEEAARWAANRSGSVSFAIEDECGRLLGEHRFRRYYSASQVKAMLLVAYLRREDVADRELSTAERGLLESMIELSDNDAADTVFAGVGEAGLDEVAAAAGMRDFVASPYWGGSAITAGDQAAFLAEIERYVPKRHERFALDVLAGVIPEHRWGIPGEIPRGWSTHLKGGWYPADDGWRVNQVVTARRHDRSFAVAVLSDGNPSFEYGQETVREVAERLLSPAARTGSRASARSRPRRGPPRPRR